MHRAEEVDYEDLGEPYYQVEVEGDVLWAWNFRHLDMLFRLLSGESVENHEYGERAKFCRGSWLKNRERFARAIQVLRTES